MIDAKAWDTSKQGWWFVHICSCLSRRETGRVLWLAVFRSKDEWRHGARKIRLRCSFGSYLFLKYQGCFVGGVDQSPVSLSVGTLLESRSFLERKTLSVFSGGKPLDLKSSLLFVLQSQFASSGSLFRGVAWETPTELDMWSVMSLCHGMGLFRHFDPADSLCKPHKKPESRESRGGVSVAFSQRKRNF